MPTKPRSQHRSKSFARRGAGKARDVHQRLRLSFKARTTSVATKSTSKKRHSVSSSSRIRSKHKIKNHKPLTILPQTISFFQLPYELREQIYVYTFVSSRVAWPDWEDVGSWDALALVSRQTKNELDHIPMRLLLGPLKAAWAHSGAAFPIYIISYPEYCNTGNIAVYIPRSAWESSWLLFRLLSTVLSFRAQRTTISVYNDSNRLVSLEEMSGLVQCIRAFLFVRTKPWAAMSRHMKPNALEVVILWAGHISFTGSPSDEVWGITLMRPPSPSKIPACVVCPIRSGVVTLQSMTQISLLDGIVISSETGFRPKRRTRLAKLELVSHAQFVERYDA
jgi:hypothetical protein